MFKILAAVFLTAIVVISIKDVGVIPQCSLQPYSVFLPLQLFWLFAAVMAIGYGIAKE